jgi:DNA gyrase subunit B
MNNLVPKSETFRAGLTAAVSVQLPEPQFDSQEKKRLNNLEVEGMVATVVGDQFGAYLAANPKVAARIMKKIARSAANV